MRVGLFSDQFIKFQITPHACLPHCFLSWLHQLVSFIRSDEWHTAPISKAATRFYYWIAGLHIVDQYITKNLSYICSLTFEKQAAMITCSLPAV